MTVIDARSGQRVSIGQVVRYPDGESITLLGVRPGVLQASAYVQMTYADHSRAGSPLMTKELWVPLVVRWLHPQFPFHPVAFLPS